MAAGPAAAPRPRLSYPIATGDRLLAGNCAKGNPSDKSGIQNYRQLSVKVSPPDPETFSI